jgi:hypothetical protein
MMVSGVIFEGDRSERTMRRIAVRMQCAVHSNLHSNNPISRSLFSIADRHGACSDS